MEYNSAPGTWTAVKEILIRQVEVGIDMRGALKSNKWSRGIMAIMTDCLSVDRGSIPREIANMGDGTAWGGHLVCTEKIRWVRFPYLPPLC